MSRYEVDNKSQLLTLIVEEDRPTTSSFQDLNSEDKRVTWLSDVIKDFILPEGYPGN